MTEDPLDFFGGWVWVSFVDPDRPEGERFLGVVIAPGSTDLIALTAQSLWECGLNPGGGVAMINLAPEHVPPPEYRLRLLSKEEAESL
jgi:hypothetical protein